MHVGLTLSELQRYYIFSYTSLVLDRVFVFCIFGLLSNGVRNDNKFVQSNLARGPRRGAVAHVRPIGRCGQWQTPNSPPPEKSTPSHGPIAKPHHLLYPWSRPTYDAKQHPDQSAVFHNALDRQTDRQTDLSLIHI